MFDAFKTADIVTAGNPVDCSCNSDIASLLDWMAVNTNHKVVIECTTPTSMNGKKLTPATKGIVCPCPTTLCTCTAAKYVCDKKTTGVTEEDLIIRIITKLKNFAGELQIPKYLKATLKEEVFKLAPKIKMLTIGGTAITMVNKNAFKGMTALTFLRITGTAIKTLPESVFAPIKGTLTELYVNKNAKLAAIPVKTFQGLSKLTQLDLSENAMKSFTSSMFKDVKSATINAEGNPVACSCNNDITGLISWLKENPEIKLAIKCKTPTGVAKKFIKSLSKSDVCKTPPAKTTPKPKPKFGALPDWAFVIIIAIIGVIILVIIGIFCQSQKRRFHEEQKRREAESGIPITLDGYDNEAYMTNQ
jgi:hypothetical protein